MNYTEIYKEELKYIDGFWDKVTIRPRRREKILNVILKKSTKRMHKNILNIPHPFIVPTISELAAGDGNRPGWFAHMFYWDTFFMFKGLIGTRHEPIMRSMVDNFIYLYEKYGIIPNFNSPASTGRSQPPFLTSMILDAYDGYYFANKKLNRLKKIAHDLRVYKEWLLHATDVAKREYWKVWIDQDGFYHHKVNGFSLNRYGDRDVGYAHSAELESGWDLTSRFYNRCNDFLPVDLNAFLYKYERDFEKIAGIFKSADEQEYWSQVSKKRLKEINKYMWNDKKGFFFDYNFAKSRQSDFFSLAGFTPLWAGLATNEQASKMVKKLSLFETDYGLTITSKNSLASQVSLKEIPERFRPAVEEVLKPKQWDWPNIWPPLEYLTVIGLLKYGFINDARRIMEKSLSAQSKIFKKYKTFFEKLDGTSGDKTGDFHYTNQSGFGWTNAEFFRYVQILDALESGKNIYADPKNDKPPYKLSIPH